MRRRELIGLAVGAEASWPCTGVAQQLQQPRRIGVLFPFPEQDSCFRSLLTVFARELARPGWIEGENIRIDYRFAAVNPALFPIYAAELLDLSPDAIFASALPAVAALQDKTRTVPIVFVFVPDPVALGLIRSLARPGGNLSGFVSFDLPMMAKWLELS